MALTKIQLNRLSLEKLQPILDKQLSGCKKKTDHFHKIKKQPGAIKKAHAWFKKELVISNMMMSVIKKLYVLKDPKPEERNRRHAIDLCLTERMIVYTELNLSLKLSH